MPAKKIWIVLLVTLATMSGVVIQDRLHAKVAANADADRAAITGVLTKQQLAWNDGNVDLFLTGYWNSPELTFSGSSGVARGWDGVLARYKKSYPDRKAMGQLDFSGLEFRFLGPDAALVLGSYHLKLEKGDAGGVFSLVWQRFPEGWKIVHDHTSKVEAKTAAKN
jgi:L-asparaginase / beta-aspartyl-peptidase